MATTSMEATGSTWAVGQMAQCTNGGGTGAQSFAYQWSRDSNPIAGAASSTYLLSPGDAGTTLSCAVTATGRGGTMAVTSVGPALAAAPAVLTAPSITGTPRPTRVLTCNRGTWSGATSYTYTWGRNGLAIAGATTTKYTVLSTDIGATLTCVVRANGPGGATLATTAGVVVRP